MTLKPFDLNLAVLGHPICFGDGVEARFIAHVPDAAECSRVVVLPLRLDEEVVAGYEDGYCGIYYNDDLDKDDTLQLYLLIK